MLDDHGFDYGILTGIGLMIAAAIVLIMVFAIFKATAPANTAIALESAADRLSGDIGIVAAMAIPYSREETYEANGIDLSITSDHVVAKAGCSTFARPLIARICPGHYVENQTMTWNDTAGMRRYLNETFNATGERQDPIEANRSAELLALMGTACRSMAEEPIAIEPKRPTVIEKLYIYYDGCMAGGEPYVFVYQR